MHRSYISRIESGAIQLPELETRNRFHEIFGTSEEDLEGYGIVPRYDQWGRVIESGPDHPLSGRAQGSSSATGYLTTGLSPDTEQPPALLAEARGKIVRLLDERDIPYAVLNGIVSMLEGFPPTSPPDTL
jgi:hypothetical protein